MIQNWSKSCFTAETRSSQRSEYVFIENAFPLRPQRLRGEFSLYSTVNEAVKNHAEKEATIC